MKEITLTVVNQLGLHGHPASDFIQASNSFNSQIWIEKESRRANAKSLLGVLSLGIFGGDKLKIVANGPDEYLAIQTLEKIINSSFENSEELQSWLGGLSHKS